MSYTLTQILIVLKDQDKAQRDAEAEAIEQRSRRHIRIADYLNEIVKALIILRISPPRIEEYSAVSNDDHKTPLMQPSSPMTLGENAPEQPPDVTERNVHRPALLHALPVNSSNETGRASNSETPASGGPPSRSTRVVFVREPPR